MKHQLSCGLIVMWSLLLAVSCQAEKPDLQRTPATTSSQEAGEPTAVPTSGPQLEPTPAFTSTPDRMPTLAPDMMREVLDGVLPTYLMNGDFSALEEYMGDEFVINYWPTGDQTQTASQALSPAEAVQALRLDLLPDPSTFRFTNDKSLYPDLDDVDPNKAFGVLVKVVDLVYSGGWGANGQGEAFLAIGLAPEGKYWPGMIYAPAGFEQIDPTLLGTTLTFTNEHAGYAFDYPTGWIVQGTPRPESYNYVISLRSSKMDRGPGSVPGDELKIDFVTCNSAQCSTLSALQAQIERQVAAGTLEILSEENWVLPGGIPAVRRQVVGEMGLEVASLITEISGNSLQVSAYGDLPRVDEILRTLRPAGGDQPEGELRARLEVPPSLPLGEPVTVQFFLINETGESLYILNWFTPLEGLGGDIFRVTRDGQTIRYQGPLVGRGDPTPEAYTYLESGETAWAEVDLSQAYDFSQPGKYTITFSSPRFSHIARSEAEMARSMDALGPIEIPSNEVSVTIGSA